MLRAPHHAEQRTVSLNAQMGDAKESGQCHVGK
jgi:hypothetical protein